MPYDPAMLGICPFDTVTIFETNLAKRRSKMSVSMDSIDEDYSTGFSQMAQEGHGVGFGDQWTAYLAPYAYSGSNPEDWLGYCHDGFVQVTTSPSLSHMMHDQICPTPEEATTSTHSTSPAVDTPPNQPDLLKSEKTEKQLRRKAQNRESQRNFRQRKDQSLRDANDTIVRLQNQAKDQQQEIARLTGLLQQTRIEVQTLRSILTPQVANVNNFSHGSSADIWPSNNSRT